MVFCRYRVYESDVIEGLRGKVVIEATNPLNPDWSPLVLAHGRSGAEEHALLLPASVVVKAFNTVFADTMTASGLDRGGARVTTFVAGDDAEVRTGSRDSPRVWASTRVAGPLRNAAHLEALAHLHIHIAMHEGAGTDVAVVCSDSRAPGSRTVVPPPSMAAWEAAWARGDAAGVSRAAIEHFLSGGVGKVRVTFEPTAVVGRDSPRFEYGRFVDRDAVSGHEVATGTYAVTWVLDEARWLIWFHGRNSPAS